MPNNKKYQGLVLGCALMSLLPLGHAADTDANASAVAPFIGATPYTGYAAASWGDGLIGGDGAIGHKTMRGRAAEIRIGHTFDPFGLVSGGSVAAPQAPRLAIVYYNEGHHDNNHRDGYAVQMVLRKKIQQVWDMELGVGPYFSMNRPTINGNEFDDERTGVLVSLALIGRLDAYSPGLQWRLGYNHVAMPGAPRSDALIVG